MIAEMGGLAEQQIADAVDALDQRDPDLAQRIIADDAKIDALQREIEEKAILTIARRQPMAVDLREIVGALHIANDLERIGDLAKNIAKRVLGARRRVPAAEADARRRAHGRAGAGASSRTCSTPMRGATSPEALAVWRGDEEIDAIVHLAVPRAPHLHDGRPAQHHASAPISCSAPRTSSASATTRPTSPRPSITWSRASPIAGRAPEGRHHQLRRDVPCRRTEA